VVKSFELVVPSEWFSQPLSEWFSQPLSFVAVAISVIAISRAIPSHSDSDRQRRRLYLAVYSSSALVGLVSLGAYIVIVIGGGSGSLYNPRP